MRVFEIMSDAVQRVAPTVSARDAIELMGMKRIRHLVVAEGSRLTGIVSERDLGGRNGAAARQDRTVGDMTTSPVVTVAHDTPVRKAANLMRGRSIGCLVVMEGNRIAGIVTAADLLELIGRGADRASPTRKRADLHYRSPHRAKKTGTGVW